MPRFQDSKAKQSTSRVSRSEEHLQPSQKSTPQRATKTTVDEELAVYKQLVSWKDKCRDLVEALRTIVAKGDNSSKIIAKKAIRNFEETK